MNILRLLPVAALAVVACQPAATPREAPPLAGATIGGPFALVDQDARPVTDRTFAGKYRIMYFGYTFCPDVCPTDAAAIGKGLAILDRSDPALARRIVPVFVSVDPERDTPAVLKSFVANFHPRMVGLTGTPAQIAAVAKAYAVFAGKGDRQPGGGYLVNHSRTTYLMDPDGKPLAILPSDKGAQAVADEIRRWAA
ncbi:SCO family protein [Sphingomonas sp. A2-49]|uniref:SCO family protein n=1 Tax=Sphingomonas sp. A2-49 TaxID=1391375 RepID=UPI0021CE97F7|nr:SCO family protein [Sphingomonas sp. A2-49]MCU6454227.1 SCO family protein [Sphingomonas sp. A2-49]